MRLFRLSMCFVIGCTLLSSCQKDLMRKESPDQTAASEPGKANQALKFNTFYGPQVEVGEGHARTFSTISHTGVPQEIGVILTDEALSGLPTQNIIYNLDFHHKAVEATLFEHVALGLSARGHGLQPTGRIEAHFDFRFFMMTLEERLAIPAPATTSTGAAGGGFDVLPQPGYLPSGYAWNFPVAQIGRHWSENTFTSGVHVEHTMIYGTWNGELTFINPIVTLETLASGTPVSVNYPQPEFVAKHGYYATKYNIYEDGKGRHYVSLSGFVLR
ncbi:MAG: hypothetical protein M3Q06_14360 [Bacteroidota bacterium]|nr:hypothetical protein [Bacteroidota bacterium]